jgi:hypothetical protein
MELSATNKIAAAQAAITLITIALLAFGNQEFDAATMLLLTNGALSAAGFKSAADASPCCVTRRSIGTCPELHANIK